MGKKCHICKKKCTGDVLKADADKLFHPQCFVCKICSQQLSDSGFYTTVDGAYVCTRHANFSTPLSIETDRSKLPDQLSPSLHSQNCCAACGEHLQSGQALIALGQSWHVWCFKCAECSAVLQGEYMLHNGKTYCIRDYNQLYGVKCCECERYIAGRVLQAGGYKFHPTCARCSRCGDIFIDGQEMYMQGNEIWHPKCESYSIAEDISMKKKGKKQKQTTSKFQPQFGQHLTYMYMLPETEQTNLRQPISPHPPQPAQFHTPHGPVIKIRKSRYSMLKTGMQRLTEDMDRSRPRSKSPHMDNEEPIELAHYPGAHIPEPDEIPPIEKEDFPAPPYPYAVEEIKRRLSSSSIENDEDDEEELHAAVGKINVSKVHHQVKTLDQIDKNSSIAHVLKQNLIEESERKQNLPLHWDPRNASRTASAKKMPHLQFRYAVPINASPSRHLNRPKPWVFWKDGSTTIDRSATTQLPCFHLPHSRTGTERAITLPDGYGYYSGTLNSHFSDHSINEMTLPEYTPGPPMSLRSSLPDMSKPVKTYPYEKIKTTSEELPEDVDRQHLERHLNREEFEDHFGMTPIEFYKLPEWKRINIKRKLKLF